MAVNDNVLNESFNFSDRFIQSHQVIKNKTQENNNVNNRNVDNNKADRTYNCDTNTIDQ